MAQFLSALLDSSSLVSLAQPLLTAGVDTPEHLVALLRLSERDEILRRLLDKLPGVPKIAAALLRKGLKATKARDSEVAFYA